MSAHRLSAALVACVACVALLAPATARAAEGAVAVMPFQNLANDGSLDWLRHGIAETMINDLSKLGRPVVERTALDAALAELALADSGGTTEATAARAGKLVGARTVVVGGFQRAGAELRITARFVAVETGLVQGTAKATGKLTDVFALQDQIIGALVGPAATKQRPRRKRTQPRKPQATVDAYRLYAQSLTTSSDAERVTKLKQAVAVDPDFDYAVDALRLLEARMRGYARSDTAERDRAHDEARRVLASRQLPDMERAQRAFQLLSSGMVAQRWRRVLDDCAFLLDVGVPPLGTMTIEETCSHYRFLAYLQLKRGDDALKQGERHLARYPGSATFGVVKMQMQAEIDRRRQQATSRAQLDDELAELESERAQRVARRPQDAVETNRHHDWRRCAESYMHAAFDRTLDECGAYLREHAGEANAYEAEELARFYVMMARTERGEFDLARAEAERLLDERAAFAEKMHLAMMMSTWPRD